MPPRVVVVLIIAFWLGSTGWLIHRQWWPWLNADAPPPFTVELADEAAPLVAHWTIWRGNQKIGHAITKMTCLKDDSFDLYSAIDNLEFESFGVRVKVPKLITTQNVTREGALRTVKSRMDLALFIVGDRFDIRAILDGEVKDGQLHAACLIEPFGGNEKLVLEPIPLEAGSMLNPLQPMAKMSVRPGQRWKITNVNPLSEALKAAIPQLIRRHLGGAGPNLSKSIASPPKLVLAKVLSEPRDLTHQGKSISCYVIEYHSDDVSGTTWVQASDGKVLRQEVSGDGEKMVLLRED